MKKLRWGILSTAKIAREKVIPAIQRSTYSEVVAIASRNAEQANAIAQQLNIPKAYGSYEELLSDAQVDAVYIPLPNHMHVEWAIKSLQAGKHVLCEKPIGVSAADALQLLEVAKLYPHLKVMEAFMYRFHPQWQYVKKLVADRQIGELKTIQSFFSYYNIDMNNIRNRKDAAGGGLMDIGCYCISWSRWLFDEEPKRVISLLDYNPQSNTDRMASAILQFPSGTSAFTCSTQLMPYQRVNILGEERRIEVDIPVNAPPNEATKVTVYTKSGSQEILFDPVDQYTLQADVFAQAVMNNTELPVTLYDAIDNLKVIEALFESNEKNSWVEVGG
jgi:predicted dehydrogenase